MEAKKYESKIVLEKEGKRAEATKLMAVMGLGVKCGQTVNGRDFRRSEDEAFAAVKAFFEANL